MSRVPSGSTSVLFVLNNARFFVTHRLRLAEGVRDAGFSVEVALPFTDDYVDRVTERGFVVHDSAIDQQGLNIFRELSTFVGLYRLYRRERPDIVHHVTVKPVLYGSLAARLAGVPRVVNAISGLGTLFSVGGVSGRLLSAVAWAAYGLALRHPCMRLIFQNEEDRGAFLRAGIVPERYCVLIPGSGVELEKHVVVPEPAGVPVVLLAARLLREKGVYEFVAAARQLREEGINARFVISGDTASNRKAVDQSELDGWRDEGIVELTGWVSDMPALIAASTIVCLPSYYKEGVPKALLEASAGGRPIVTTDVPGCRDAVEHGVTGIVVPPRDLPALTAALRLLLSDAVLRTRMGEAGRRRAEARFDVRQVVSSTVALYKSMDP